MNNRAEDHFIRTTEVMERELRASHIAAFPVECCEPERDMRDLTDLFEKRDFSHVPVRDEGGVIRGVLERDACRGRVGPAREWMNRNLDAIVIESRLPLRDAVRRLEETKVLLVRSPEAGLRDGISGIINHADLEKAPVRVLIFTRLAEIEARLRTIVHSSGVRWETREGLKGYAKQAEKQRKTYKGALPLVYYLNLQQLSFVAKTCAPRTLSFLGDTDAEGLRKTRNIVAHNSDFEPGHHPALTVARVSEALALVDRVAEGLAKAR